MWFRLCNNAISICVEISLFFFKKNCQANNIVICFKPSHWDCFALWIHIPRWPWLHLLGEGTWWHEVAFLCTEIIPIHVKTKNLPAQEPCWQHLKQDFRNSRHLCTCHFGHILKGSSHVCLPVSLVCPYFAKLVLRRVSISHLEGFMFQVRNNVQSSWLGSACLEVRRSQPSLVIIRCFKSKGLGFLSSPHKTDDTPRAVAQEYMWRCTQRNQMSPGHRVCSENTGCSLHLMSRLASHLGATNYAGSVGMHV